MRDQQLVVALGETGLGPYWASIWRLQREVECLRLIIECDADIVLTPENTAIDRDTITYTAVRLISFRLMKSTCLSRRERNYWRRLAKQSNLVGPEMSGTGS